MNLLGDGGLGLLIECSNPVQDKFQEAAVWISSSFRGMHSFALWEACSVIHKQSVYKNHWMWAQGH